MNKPESGENLSQTDSSSSGLEPASLKKTTAASQALDGKEVKQSRSLTQGYEMDKDLNKTVSADVLPPPCSSGLENDQSTIKKINDEVMGSFVRAVHRKYSDFGELENCFLGGLVLPKCSAVKVTESGNMLLPNQVSMSGCEISVAGNTDLIKRMCQKVTHLDLMANDIKQWDEVLSILECIPNLTFLNLSKNHINSALPDLSGRSLPNLTHLVLNDTDMKWDVLLQLLSVCPLIEELHLSLNGFTSVDIPETHSPCPSVQKLFFIGNHVTDWNELNKIGRLFPNLESLMLCETDMYSLGEAENLGESFPTLHILSLNRSCLSSWEEIEKLNEFPCLTDIRLHNIPFFEDFPTKYRRHRQIAMLPRLTMLNKSPVSEDEREDAERAFIRLFMDEEEKPQRYHDLVSKHGSLEPLVKIDLKPKETVQVKIIVEELGENEDMNDNDKPGEIMDLDVHHTVKSLRKMLSNTTGHPANKLLLFHNDKALSLGAERMIYQDRKILAYHVHDGDDIVVVKKP